MNIKIIVAAHKNYNMPGYKCYIPVQVGAKGKADIGYTPDDTGDNISHKNPNFCELTGLYWGWKNLECDYLGLAHYRRHFKEPKTAKKGIEAVLSDKTVEKLLQKNDIILPTKRKYYIENLYSHYEHTMHIEPLLEVREILAEKYPEYIPEFDRLKKRTSAHMFNMYIMKKEISDKYCEWLFDILFALEEKFGDADYDSFHARFYGRVSELLLDVYINTNKLQYAETPLIYTEKIDWYRKITGFLKAKFLGKKYDKSF